MDTSEHNFPRLFEQLGLPSDEASIQKFISDHSPIPAEMHIYDAPFWNESQAHFLQEGLEDNADWAEVIDELDAQLRL